MAPQRQPRWYDMRDHMRRHQRASRAMERLSYGPAPRESDLTSGSGKSSGKKPHRQRDESRRDSKPKMNDDETRPHRKQNQRELWKPVSRAKSSTMRRDGGLRAATIRSTSLRPLPPSFRGTPTGTRQSAARLTGSAWNPRISRSSGSVRCRGRRITESSPSTVLRRILPINPSNLPEAGRPPAQ